MTSVRSLQVGRAAKRLRQMGGLCARAALPFLLLFASASAETPARAPSARLDVRDFGATLDGKRDDTPAFSAARAAAVAGQTIVVPPGTFHPRAALSGGPKGAVFWDLQGVGYDGADAVPVIGIEHDLVANVLPGGVRYFGRGPDTRPEVGPVLRVDRSFAYDGGVLGNVSAATVTNCDLKGEPRNYVWCNQTVVHSKATGKGQHLAVAGSIFRPKDALADGKGPRAQTWGGYFENNDQTGQPSDVAGAQVGIENDVYSGGPDPKGYRILLQMNVGKSSPGDAPAEVRHGVLIGSSDGASSVGKGFALAAPFYLAAFDASGARSLRDAPAFRMAQSQKFCFEATNQHCLVYDAGRLSFLDGPARSLEMIDHGGLRLANYVTDPPANASQPGALYFNTTERALRMYDGTRWVFVVPRAGRPNSSRAPCAPGDRRFDANFMYICVAADTWRRARLDAF